MAAKTRGLIVLGVLAVLDTVIPVPVTALIVIYAILQRPPWVIGFIHEIYGIPASEGKESEPR